MMFNKIKLITKIKVRLNKLDDKTANPLFGWASDFVVESNLLLILVRSREMGGNTSWRERK